MFTNPIISHPNIRGNAFHCSYLIPRVRPVGWKHRLRRPRLVTLSSTRFAESFDPKRQPSSGVVVKEVTECLSRLQLRLVMTGTNSLLFPLDPPLAPLELCSVSRSLGCGNVIVIGFANLAVPNRPSARGASSHCLTHAHVRQAESLQRRLVPARRCSLTLLTTDTTRFFRFHNAVRTSASGCSGWWHSNVCERTAGASSSLVAYDITARDFPFRDPNRRKDLDSEDALSLRDIERLPHPDADASSNIRW
ncbi:hypothetical protein VTK26DRAFT_2583 [Humicola hyalothermophila]